MDVSIIKAFKSHYTQWFISKSIQHYNQGVPITKFNVFNIDQLAAMHLSCLAWKNASPAVIAKCCNHTGIFGHPTVPGVDTNDSALEKQIDWPF
jgi:hypothetical protein